MKKLLSLIIFLGLATCTYAQVEFTTLTLTWNDNSDNEDGFKVERMLDGESWTQYGEVIADVATFSDEDVPYSRTISYRVRAWNSYGESGYTNIVAEATFQPIPPDNLRIKRPGNPVSRWFNKGRNKKHKEPNPSSGKYTRG
jgi:hypothetical protein